MSQVSQEGFPPMNPLDRIAEILGPENIESLRRRYGWPSIDLNNQDVKIDIYRTAESLWKKAAKKVGASDFEIEMLRSDKLGFEPKDLEKAIIALVS